MTSLAAGRPSRRRAMPSLRTATLALAAVLSFACATCFETNRPDPLPGFPRLMLWAWERPEDLRFLNPAEAGVAFLAGTVGIRNGKSVLHPRLQPLLLAPGTKTMAVVRIESSGAVPNDPSSAAGLIAKLLVMPGVSGLQLDYDAAYSERGFYRDLTRIVREKMPRTMPLTMTALVSWCTSDGWISGLPVADAVPMYFRMGPAPYLRQAKLHTAVCGASTGLSTDELFRVPLHRRVFLFHPHPWTRDALRTAMNEMNRWL